MTHFKQIRTMKISEKYIIFIISILLFSCNDFLNKSPDNRTTLENKESIKELLVSAYPLREYYSFLEPMTDSYSDKGTNQELYNTISIKDAYYWNDHTTDDAGTPLIYWNACYNAIAHCNTVLEKIESLKTPKELLPQKGEALLARAYAHFMLVNIFAKHYNPKTAVSDPGIPWVDKPENKVSVKYKRNSVAEIYKNIETDIEAGLEMIRDDEYEIPKYHFSTTAACAFATRFYLYKGDWQKVIDHSNRIITSEPEENLRKWNTQYQNYTYSELIAQYTKSEESANVLLSTTYSLWGRYFANDRYGMTEEIKLELFPYSDDNIFSMNYIIFGGSEDYYNVPKFKEYFKYTDVSSGIGIATINSILFTFEEVLLNRAEALAMLNQVDKSVENITIFLKSRVSEDRVNTVLSKYKEVMDEITNPEPHYNLTAENLPIIKYIIELRRREFIYEGLRWFDIKRFNLSITHKSHNDEEFILQKDDLRKVVQIPEQAILTGLKPNPR